MQRSGVADGYNRYNRRFFTIYIRELAYYTWGTMVGKIGVSDYKLEATRNEVQSRARVSVALRELVIRTLQNLFEGYVANFMQRRWGILVELRQMEPQFRDKQKEVDTIIQTPEFLQSLLLRFKQVFEMPKGLPPKRNHEHAIVLKEGSNPVSVRPYRYPQFQKDEIEKLIQEMLDAEIIRPSYSPFSSPVLLVKKKDGSWRFCVDYRAIKKETVPDKYLIPVIDELLDELGVQKYLQNSISRPGTIKFGLKTRMFIRRRSVLMKGTTSF